jgi:tetratricopeptide (TPR) repeat protein
MTVTAPLRLPNARRWRIGLLILLLALAAGAGWYAWRGRPPKVLVVPTEGMDWAIAAAIDDARGKVEQQPDSAEAWGHYAQVVFAHLLYAESEPLFAKAEELAPDDARWPYYRGMALRFDKPEQSVTALRKALAMRPRDGPFKLRLAELLLALDQLDEAEQLVQELAKSPDVRAQAWLKIGQIRMHRGQWGDALNPLQLAADDPLTRKAAHTAMSEVFLRLGKENESAAEQKMADSLSPDADWPDPLVLEAGKLRTGLEARLEKANALFSEGDVELAIVDVQRLTREYADSDSAWTTLGRMQGLINHSTEAEAALRRAISINPHRAESLLLLAGALLTRNDHRAAEDVLKRAVAEKPTLGLGHFYLGVCRQKRGDHSGAERAFRDAVNTAPDFAPAHLELGKLLLANQRRAEAIASLENAARLDPTNSKTKDALAEAKRK